MRFEDVRAVVEGIPVMSPAQELTERQNASATRLYFKGAGFAVCCNDA